MDAKDLRRKLIDKTKNQISENLSDKEVHIIKSIRLVNDLDAINNLLKENIEDWEKRTPEGEVEKLLTTLKLNQSNLETERSQLLNFITKGMEEEMPSFTELAGASLGAKLLAEAGSKKRLAFAPASTIQVLGAEKALFEHLKNKKKVSSPKHGLIFNHPLLQKLPKNKRGKAARILAGKLSITARIDYFGGEKTDLKQEVENKVSNL